MKPLIMAFYCLLLAVASPQIFAQKKDQLPDSLASTTADSISRRNTNILVRGKRHNLDRLGALSNAIQPTSVVTPEAIFLKNADDFTQAVTSEPGVCVLTGCSSCGFKQIQINGLGANHTTMLIDGLPIYTPVTSFYGVDALTTAGVASINISRGPGASLLAPGAMGGAVDVRFQDPTETSATADAAGGNNGWAHLSFSATAVTDSGKLGVLVAGHHFQQSAWDANGTGVSQSPYFRDESGLVRLNGLMGTDEDFSWNLRYSHSYSEVFGASTTTDHQGATIGPPDSIPLYVGGNVNSKFLGNPIDIIEWIQTTRDEVAGALTWDSPEMGLWQLHAGTATQSQNSMYEDGADYANVDRTFVGDLRWQVIAGDHTLTLGVDANSEEMASQSVYYYQELGIIPDSYNTIFGGGYVQDTWSFGHERDLSLALRMDDIYVDWVDKPNSEIRNFIAAPRASLRWEFTEELTGRLSAGLGWRAPLTFFELDHGLLNNGFDVDVNKLEKAEGVGGSLSFDRQQWSFTAGAYATEVTNLEYVDQDTNLVRPLLRNDSNQLFFLDYDVQVSYRPWQWLTLGVGAAHQDLPDKYKAVELVAADETELNGRFDMNSGPATLSGDVTWIAARNLLPYGYGGQFNVFQDGVASDPKLTEAPSYFLINLKAVWKLRPAMDLYVGAENLLNYTQAGSAHDDPHYWDSQGDFNTSHIWGPLRGRQLYAGVRIKI